MTLMSICLKDKWDFSSFVSLASSRDVTVGGCSCLMEEQWVHMILYDLTFE